MLSDCTDDANGVLIRDSNGYRPSNALADHVQDDVAVDNCLSLVRVEQQVGLDDLVEPGGHSNSGFN